jgi:thioesterase DpgC
MHLLSSERDPDGWPEAVRSLAELGRGTDAILEALPEPAARSASEQQAAETAKRAARVERNRFLHTHAARVYRAASPDVSCHRPLREICTAAALEVPGLLPSRALLELDSARPQADKEGVELDQALVVSHFLRSPVSGSHLVDLLLLPTAAAELLLPEFLRTGAVRLGSVRLDRSDGVGYLTLSRPDCLNAEDDAQVADMETAVDLALLDPGIQVCVLRGDVMSHPKYRGRRVFSSGVNLKSLHAGLITYLGFMMRRELGYVNKMVRGVRAHDESEWGVPAVQKPWLAVVESFAIGGGAQLLLACDYVLAEKQAFFSLPAADEGIVPGAANLRLTRMVGGRLARQVLLGGRRIGAGEAEGRLLFDEVVASEELDAAIARSVDRLRSPAVVANRRMLLLAEERPEAFRQYMADFAVEQALRMYSLDVIAKVGRFSNRVGPQLHDSTGARR